MSVEPLEGSPANPLTFNPYAYAWANPVKLADLDGLYPFENSLEKRRQYWRDSNSAMSGFWDEAYGFADDTFDVGDVLIGLETGSRAGAIASLATKKVRLLGKAGKAIGRPIAQAVRNGYRKCINKLGLGKKKGKLADKSAVTQITRSLDAPDSLTGADSDEVKKLIPEDWIATPTKRGGGVRYADPQRRGDQVRVMPGNPNDPNPMKQGPYLVISKNGQKHRIPLKGNPTLK